MKQHSRKIIVFKKQRHVGSKYRPFNPGTDKRTGGRMFPLDITQNVNMVLFGINYRFFGGPSF